MPTSAFARRDPDLKGARVIVLGMARSGMAATRLLVNRGARVTLADRRSEDELGGLPNRARELGAEVHPGGHPPGLADSADLVVLSPGVPLNVELVAEALRRGIPVWGEIELAARFCRGRVIAITGSNGKSTVTSMIGHMLRGAGYRGGTGGNLATPFCELLSDDGPGSIHAVELSSFQLESVSSLQPEVALILNLSPDHLDRHASFDAYAAAKARLFELQSRDASAILNADDPESRRFVRTAHGALHFFSTRDVQDPGAFLRDGTLVVRTAAGELEVLDRSRLNLPGEHNVANALAAALACRLIGCSADALSNGLSTYRALPHRLELIREIGGVSFYNDSKATNPDSTARALSSFPAGTIHLILGGKDKGADWSALVTQVEAVARQVLLVGQAATALRALFSSTTAPIDYGTVGQAVRAAHARALPGDVVLLSPGCASFDQYENFEARGEDFRRAVTNLPEAEHDDA